MKMVDIITIPKQVTGREELVVLSRKEYTRLVGVEKKSMGEETKKEGVTEEDILRWSREAKKLKRAGKLPLFEDLIKKEYPKVAKKYHLK